MVELIISGPRIYTEQGVLHHFAMVIRNTQISHIDRKEKIVAMHDTSYLEFPENYHLIPGCIDVHIHGQQGKDVMDSTEQSLEQISVALAQTGVTAFLATTMTARPNEIENVLHCICQFKQKGHPNRGATLLGVHLEGPFISAQKAGAQSAGKVLLPNVDYLKKWQAISGRAIKLVTLAPELTNSLELIRFLQQENIVASIGHTDATYEQTLKGMNAGCCHVTHLFNAMRGMHQREPGVVTAALLSNKVSVELIADGVHLHPAMIELTLKLKQQDKIILITDAMCAAGLGDGQYQLGGQAVIVKQGIATLADGTLAGSTLSMITAIQHMMQFTKSSLSDVIPYASANPAKLLNLFQHKGSIAPGKDADLVVLDEQYRVVLTLVSGQIVFKKAP